MNAIRQILLITVLACAGAIHASSQALPLLQPLEVDDVSVAAPCEYITTLKAGDVLSGTFELLRGDPTGVQAFDPSGGKLGEVVLYAPGKMNFGFAAPVNGTYRIRVFLSRFPATAIFYSLQSADDHAKGAFRLSMQPRSPAVRMAGIRVEPAVRYVSPRISALAKDIEAGQVDAVARFWSDVAGKTPIVEPIDKDDFNVLVTFLWKETYDTHNVLVDWPPANFGSEHDFYMTRLAGTNVWYKTVRMARGSRFSYQLAPNNRPDEAYFTVQQDPLNRAPDNQYSILELPGAPDESWVRREPAIKGTVVDRTFQSALLNGSRRITIYTPPGYDASRGPYPLLLMFDNPDYLSGFKAATTLDNLIADHRIRPPVVCFVMHNNLSDPKLPSTRQQDLTTAWQTFADAMVTELVPWLRTSYAISSNARDVTVGGYSVGGRSAALVALRHSEVFGNVLSQSGTFWAPHAAVHVMTSSGKPEANGISRLYIEAAKLPLRFYIDVGLYEQNNGNLPADERALVEGMTVGNRHFRDVLEAKGYEVIYRETGGGHESVHFQATLAEGLIALLGPPNP